MKQETLLVLDSATRGPLSVEAFLFGDFNKKTVAIIAGLRGSEVQQVYVASQLVRKLTEHEDLLTPGTGICIIPAANPHSMNAGRRFFGTDETDLNRVFPGFERGDSSQRVVNAIMEQLSGYDFGINLTSINHPGAYANHVRLHRTGHEATQLANAFGIRWVHLHEPNAQETGSLNYNWQLWNTKAFSLLGGRGFELDVPHAQEAIEGIVRFLRSVGALCENACIPVSKPQQVHLLEDRQLLRVNVPHAGIFTPFKDLDEAVHKGEVLGTVRHALKGTVVADVLAPRNGTIFYRYPGPLACEGIVGFTIAGD